MKGCWCVGHQSSRDGRVIVLNYVALLFPDGVTATLCAPSTVGYDGHGITRQWGHPSSADPLMGESSFCIVFPTTIPPDVREGEGIPKKHHP